MPREAKPSESLAAMLRIERRREGEWSARLEDFWGGTLQGDLLARAALAAADGCEGKQLHALHASFLHPAAPDVALRLIVEPLGESDGMQRVQVPVLDDERLLCHVLASFATPQASRDAELEYQGAELDRTLPPPEELPSTRELAKAEGWSEYARGPVEFRRAGVRHGSDANHATWVLPRAPLPDDPRLHTAALVFLCGFYPHWAFEHRVGERFGPGAFRGLDCSLWLHATPHWSDWWLIDAQSEISRGGRALSQRRIYTRAGELLASAVHEARVV